MSYTTFQPSHRAQNTRPSALAAIVAETERLRAQGVQILDLGAGEPDFATPENIKDAARRALAENFTRYTATSGMMSLRQAIIERLNTDFGADYDLANCCVVSGGKQGLFNAVMALINPGDEVLVERPCWVSFPEMINFAEGKMIPVETEETDFHLTAEAVQRAITPQARLLILNSPSNPTGRVIDPVEFRKIIEVAVAAGLWVISDECYMHFVYPPRQPFSAATLPAELRARVLIAGSFSKTYAMTGWRLGFTLGPPEWIAEVLKISTQSTSGANSIAQKAGLAALTEAQDSVSMMLAEYQRRAEWLVPALNEISGIRCAMPEGAFYAFPNVKQLMQDCGFENSTQLQQTLLSEYGVALSAGSAFGLDGYLRLSYATSRHNLQQAVERIRKMQHERAK